MSGNLVETGRRNTGDFDRGNLGHGIHRRQGRDVTFLTYPADGTALYPDRIVPGLVFSPTARTFQTAILDFADQRRVAIQSDV